MGKFNTLWQVGRTFGARDGMLRLGYELQRGSGVMSRRMQSVKGWDHWDLKQIAPEVQPEDVLASRRKGFHPFFFADPRTLVPGLRKVMGTDSEASIQAEANNILRGTLPYFGPLSFACGFPPNWFQNPVTGQHVSPARSWTGMRFASPDYGDLKFILEPSRFLFVYPLARAYALSGDERFPEAFWTAIEDWARRSPPMSGPLWICGQESSLRILALCFALYAFIHSPVTTPKRAALLLSMVAAHAWRTAQTVGYARSQRSNHLFSEAVGLWTAGTLFPELEHAAEWQKRGAQLLSEAVRDQITPEGAFLQHSFNYQRMVLHLLLWTLRLAEIHRIELDPEIRARTEASLLFMRHFVDEASGHAPNYGSNDGSQILPLAACEYGDYRPVLQLGASILGLPSPLKPGPWDEPSLWFDGSTPARSEVTPARVLSDAAGYHRIGSATSWAMVRAGHYTRRPLQADQLHVDIWWHGLNLARDAGTYLYNADPPWNNAFAGTVVHNTVMVDRHDQMRRAGRFLWVNWAQASGRSFSRLSAMGAAGAQASFPDSFEGEHDGYRRQHVVHRRMLYGVEENAWVIVDDLLGANEHDLRLHWLTLDLPFEIEARAPFSVSLKREGTRFRWNISCNAPGTGGIVRTGNKLTDNIIGDDEQLLGWESPTYGERKPAVSIVYDVRARLPVRLITAILADESIQIRRDAERLELWRGDAQLFQTGTAPGSALR